MTASSRRYYFIVSTFIWRVTCRRARLNEGRREARFDKSLFKLDATVRPACGHLRRYCSILLNKNWTFDARITVCQSTSSFVKNIPSSKLLQTLYYLLEWIEIKNIDSWQIDICLCTFTTYCCDALHATFKIKSAKGSCNPDLFRRPLTRRLAYAYVRIFCHIVLIKGRAVAKLHGHSFVTIP